MALNESTSTSASTSPRTHAILGALLEVHRELGPGWPEETYLEAASVAFAHHGIPFVRDVRIPIWYKGRLLDAVERAPIVAHGEVLLQLQATAAPSDFDAARVRALLRASRLPVGLLVCCGGTRLQVRRFARVEAPAGGPGPGTWSVDGHGPSQASGPASGSAWGPPC